jgi:iron(III) transport system substrate-binding protein
MTRDTDTTPRDTDETRRGIDRRRRRLLAATGAGALAAIAGCVGDAPGSQPSTARSSTTSRATPEATSQATPQGTPAGTPGARATPPFEGRPDSRPEPGGTPMAELPELSGSLTVFSGRSERLVRPLLEYIAAINPDLELDVLYGSASRLANRVLVEGENTRADVVYSINVPGTLGALKSKGSTARLPDAVLSMLPELWQDDDGQWVVTSGRARAVPYNTDMISPEEIPDKVLDFPGQSQFENAVGWPPAKATFHAFVTAMRVLEGEERTKQWFREMIDLDPKSYSGGFGVNKAVADGEVAVGFSTHYYHKRILDARSDPPIDITFTKNDSASVLAGAGAGVLDSARDPETAAGLVRYLLSAEAQEYFAIPDRYEYPVIEGVDPMPGLPALSEINTPEIGPADLTDLAGTLELLRNVGLIE